MNKQRIAFSGIGTTHFQPSEEFSSKFPNMTQLLKKALVINFIINENQRFREYIWTKNDGSTCGWLCQLEHCIPQGRNIISEHILFSKNVGGILKYWSENKRLLPDSLIDNNVFTFSLTDTFIGIGSWEEKYISDCNNNAIKPLNINNFVTFALEANGNTTFYHKDTTEVFLFAHDGYSVFDIIEAEHQPNYTIHKFVNIKTFSDYVEVLATQWLKIVE